MLWVLICTVHLTVRSCHVSYAFQRESTLYSCLNVKELLAPSKREIWSLSDRIWTRTHNHFLDIWATIECGFTLKRVRDMTRTYSQMHRTDKYSQHSSIIWPIWLNGWVFVYELSGCGFESRCSHLNFRFRACFEQGVPWHSGKYKVWIHSETRTWHDKNIQTFLDSIYEKSFSLIFTVSLLMPVWDQHFLSLYKYRYVRV